MLGSVAATAGAGPAKGGGTASGSDDAERLERAAGREHPLVRNEKYSEKELEEIKKLKEFERLFRWGSSVYQAVAEHVIERTYLNEKAKIKKQTADEITDSRKTTEVRRMEAIKEFEAWIKRHPKDRRWRPDILFRLAELYYEKATVDFQYASVQRQEAVLQIRKRARELGRELPEPPEPQIDYSISIAYYRKLINEFPDYENIGVVYYLLGYCLREMSKQAEEVAPLVAEKEESEAGKKTRSKVLAGRARQAFLALVCSNRYNALAEPKPPEAPESLLVEEGAAPAAAGASSGAASDSISAGSYDPYKGCRPAIRLSKYSGRDLDRRKDLLSQAWFLLGEQHFDADPIVTLTEAEKEELKQQFFRHRDAERYRNDYQQKLAEKKEKRIKVHNYYAISAYTRIVKELPDAEEFADALYKRAWTYFRVNMYQQALDQFDKLLTKSKDEALRENAVRYVALCAYYQRVEPDKFAYLKNHYQQKGWLSGQGVRNHPHVMQAFAELGKIFFEEAAPPPDMPGERNYRASDLEEALEVNRWILQKGGFSAPQPGEPKEGWKYFKGKASVQKAIIDIIYLLTINNEAQKDYPRKLYHQMRRKAFNRFSTFKNSPHQRFAKKYEELHGEDPKVKEALSYLRETSLVEIANEYYMLGRKQWDASESEINEQLKAIAAAISRITELKGAGSADMSEAEERLQQERQALVDLAKPYRKYFDAAVKAYDVVITHPQFKDTLSAYKAAYFKADCLFYSHRYLEAAAAYKKVVDSKVSARYRLQALQGRVESHELHYQLNVVPPPAPNPANTKKLVATPIPQPVLDWHQAMRDLLDVEMKDKKASAQAVPYRFAIAYTYYRYGHAEKAYKKLWGFLKKHCDTPQAFYASQALLGMALIKNQAAGSTLHSLKGLDKERKKIATAQCGTKVTFPPKTPKKQMEQYATQVKDFYKKMLGLAADIRMNRADALYKAAQQAKGSQKEKRYLEAARELEGIARQNPDSPRAAVSLYYAAEGYEQTGRFRKAKALYEEIVNKPKYRKQIRSIEDEECKTVNGRQRCKKVKKNQLDNVVNFLARAAWKAMEFKQAMSYYGDLAKAKVDIDEPAIRVYSYYWYARLLRIYDNPRKSVRYYLKYHQEIEKVVRKLNRQLNEETDPKQQDAIKKQLAEARRFRTEVFYQVGNIYRKLNDLRGMEKNYGRYIEQVSRELGSKPTSTKDYYANHDSDRQAAMKMMKALHWLAVRNRERRRMSKAREYEDKIVSYFDRYNMPKGGNPAAEYAAEIAFRQVEKDFQEFMKQKLELKPIRLRTRWSKKPKVMIKLMCELMGWGQNKRGKPCQGKALPMLQSVVNPYVEKVNRITQGFMNDVGMKYLHPKWVLAVRARMGQVFAKATADLEALPLPPEVKKFWGILWPFMQKYKVYPKLKSLFVNLMSQYNIDIDDEYMDMTTVLEAYKEKTYEVIRKNAEGLRDGALENYTFGLRLARRQGVSNEWTKIMREGLHQLAPDRYPKIHDAKVAGM
jgi:hypothetical protein